MQKVVALPALIVGVVGKAFTVTVVPAEAAEVQLPAVTATVYVPSVETVIDCVVAPFDQRFPDAADEVNTTLPPVQKEVVPDALIVGAADNEIIVTITGCITEQVPAVFLI